MSICPAASHFTMSVRMWWRKVPKSIQTLQSNRNYYRWPFYVVCYSGPHLPCLACSLSYLHLPYFVTVNSNCSVKRWVRLHKQGHVRGSVAYARCPACQTCQVHERSALNPKIRWILGTKKVATRHGPLFMCEHTRQGRRRARIAGHGSLASRTYVPKNYLHETPNRRQGFVPSANGT